MAALVWDNTGERFYETGIDHGVLYPYVSGKPGTGVAWNGLSSVSESPEGAEASDIYADNMKYLVLRSVEDFKGTIEAYYYPEEWEECDGSVRPEGTVGLKLGQQTRRVFGLCYRTKVGNDVDGEDHGYKLHLVYGATASPSERQYQSVNDSPEAMTLSWEFETTSVSVAGYKPLAHLEIESMAFKTETEKACLKKLEDTLYGTAEEEPRLPLPAEVITILTPAV